jgi:hypothetical protein
MSTRTSERIGWKRCAAILFVCGCAGVGCAERIDVSIDVAIDSGPLAGNSYSGGFWYDPSETPLAEGKFAIHDFSFDFQDGQYGLDDNVGVAPGYTPTRVFLPPIVNDIPVQRIGLRLFVVDPVTEVGFRFVEDSLYAGDLYQSRFEYGGNASLVGEFGGPEFGRQGRGSVTYSTVTVPEPSTILMIATVGLAAFLPPTPRGDR